MSPLMASLMERARAHVPTREQLEGNRWLRPVAHLILRPELWRFNRRSVPRGVGIGVAVGVTIPFAHTYVAPFVAVGLRGNVPVAAVATWTSNPFTRPFMWAAAYKLGRFLLHSEAFADAQMMATTTVNGGHHLTLARVAQHGMAFATGLVVEGLVLGAIAYFGAQFGWRRWILGKRRRDLARMAARHAGQDQAG